MNPITINWKEAATKAVDDNAIEKAFADQAYGFVANKAPILMADPYRLGFEIVYKNDKANRLVGIYAFRVNGTLLYVPVFFLNGEIKGTDLLYRHNTKKFVPYTEDWVKFLMEHGQRDIGEGIERSVTARNPSRVHIQKIAMPPHLRKNASFDESIKWSDVLDEMEKRGSAPSGTLRELLIERGDTFEKLAGWIGESPKFAEALVRTVPEDDFMPPELLMPVKQAGSPTPDIEVYVPTPKSDDTFVKHASEFFKRGYSIIDNRPEGKLSAVFRPAKESFEEITRPGVYQVLMQDGSVMKLLVGNGNERDISCDVQLPRYFSSIGNNYGEDPKAIGSQVEDHSLSGDVVLVDVAGSHENSTIYKGDRMKVYGSWESDFENYDGFKESPSTGSTYRIVMPKGGWFSKPFKFISKEERNGITIWTVEPSGSWSSNPHHALIINPDMPDGDLGAGVLPVGCKFMPVATEMEDENCVPCSPGGHRAFQAKRLDKNPGDINSLSGRLLAGRCGDAAHSIEIIKSASTGEFTLIADGKRVTPDSRFGTVIRLSQDHRVGVKSAEALLDDADKLGSASFMLLDPEEKSASATVRIMNNPQFDSMRDSTFGIAVEEPQRFAVPAVHSLPAVPKARLGDVYDPSMGGSRNEDSTPMDIIMSASPDELARYADQNQLPSMFEHGAVGSLLQTYDSGSELDKYIPKLEDALDCLGRSLFLFFWKPGDFERFYGADDMHNLDSRLLSIFKSFGDLVLDLMKRSKKRQTPGPVLQ